MIHAKNPEQLLDQSHWQEVIEAHPLESHDQQEWLRYGTALLLTLQPGADAAQQQQQAALAFVQASKEGAPAEAVAAAQRQALLLNLQQAIEQAGVAGAKRLAQQQAPVSSASAAKPEPDQWLLVQRMLQVLAGIYGLTLPSGGDQAEAIEAVRGQLQQRQLPTANLARVLQQMGQWNPEFQAAELAQQLLDQLSCAESPSIG